MREGCGRIKGGEKSSSYFAGAGAAQGQLDIFVSQSEFVLYPKALYPKECIERMSPRVVLYLLKHGNELAGQSPAVEIWMRVGLNF